MTRAIHFLQSWFAGNCDGDWEHDNRIRIENLDNPGWHVWVNLVDTALEARQLPQQSIERSDTDWLVHRSDGQAFDAFGGPHNLEEALEAFRTFADEEVR
jgi:hypothetical protein